MKIIILNTSGNLGKSVIAREVFVANLEDYNLVEIETQNSSHANFNVNCTTLNTYKKLAIQLIKNDNLILDLGNSEVFETLDYLKENDFLCKIDRFVIPIIAEQKQYEDTTVLLQVILNDFKINPNKIFVVGNRIKQTDIKLLDIYITKIKTLKVNIDNNYTIYESDIFKKLGLEKKLIKELISGEDYEKMIKETEDEDEQERLFDSMCAQKPLRQLQELTNKIKNWVVSK